MKGDILLTLQKFNLAETPISRKTQIIEGTKGIREREEERKGERKETEKKKKRSEQTYTKQRN